MLKLDGLEIEKILSSLLSKLEKHSQLEIVLSLIGGATKTDKESLLKLYAAQEEYTYYIRLKNALQDPKFYGFEDTEHVYEQAKKEGFFI